MPPSDVIGGVANLSQVAAGTVATPNPPVGVFRASYDACLPRVLQLSAQQVQAAAAPSYPPGDYGNTFNGAWCSGLKCEDGTEDSLQQKAACQLVYGMGAVQETAIFDWRPGCYNLPPCTYVECSVILWGISWAPSTLRTTIFKAVTGPGQMAGAHVPTVTGVFSTGHAGKILDAPRKTAAVDVYPISTNGNVVGVEGDIAPSGASPTIYRSTDAPSDNAPGWSPVECAPATRLVLVGTGDNYIVRFFLQL